MLISYHRGQGSIVLRVKILNSSVSTGAGLTGLTFSSSGLIVSTIADNEASATAYAQASSKIEDITTLGTYAAPTATKCRFKEVDSTNHKGIYEIQIADARFAVSSAKSMIVSISGATNLAETDVCIPLSDLDPYDTVRAGLTALPNAAAAAANGLWILGSNNTAAITIGNLTASAIACTTIAASGTVTFNAFTVTNALIVSGATTLTGAVTATHASNNITGVAVTAANINAIADQIWDEVMAGHLTAGTTGAKLDAAGAAGDPWPTALPGAYAPGTAGFILGNLTGQTGPGSIEFTVTITDDMATPLDGAEVWVSTDQAGSNVIAGTLNTNASGQATFLLDAGNYWLWVVHSGFNRDNPTSITVT